MTTYNGTGAPAGWNWALSYLATAGILIGFDASGHVAEETKNAPIAAARGIFWSTIVSGLGGFAVVILFLFCVVSFDTNLAQIPVGINRKQPDAETLFSYGGPQPFVSVYAAILGEGGHIVMNVICVLALWFVSQKLRCYMMGARLIKLHRTPRLQSWLHQDLYSRLPVTVSCLGQAGFRKLFLVSHAMLS